MRNQSIKSDVFPINNGKTQEHDNDRNNNTDDYNDKDDNNDYNKGISALGIDRDLLFSQGYH